MIKRFLKNPKKAKTVNRLIRRDVKDIIFTGDHLEFTYGGKRLKYRVIKSKHLGWVGHWSGGSNTLYYDDDVLPRDRVPLLVHEGVEAYVSKRKGLDPRVDAHYVAAHVENKVLRKLGINPENYGWRIEKIYRTEMPRDKKLGKKNKLQQ